MAKIISFEGLDASFKETNSKILKEELIIRGFNAYRFEFPNYSSPSSFFAKQYLLGEYKNTNIDRSPLAKSILYTLDRFDTYTRDIKHIYESCDDNTIIIFDRWTASNMFYQTASIISDSLWISENMQIFNLEHSTYNLPIENGIIYMRTPVETARSFINNRSTSDYLEGNRSLQELVFHNADRVLDLLNTQSNINIKVVNTVDPNNQIKDRDIIFNEVLSSALNIIGGK